MPNSWPRRLVLLAAALAFTLLAAELGLRAALFSDTQRFQSLKDPALYADYFSEDLYWKLYVTLGGESKPPRRAHAILGWTGDFSRKTYRHRDQANIAERRPVLLFGDSFAACIEGVVCYQDILNAEPEFSESHYLLNYGVGGYGLDQTFLLLKNSVGLLDDPFVIVSLFTFDLDRNVLSFRVGQKPRFRVVDGALELDPSPIYAQTSEYLTTNPPRAVSYLYRKAIFGNWLPGRLAAALRREQRHRERKLEVSEKILDEILDQLRNRNLDFVFVIFHGDRMSDNPLLGGTDWREEFLRQWLTEERLPYIWSKDIAMRDAGSRNSETERYIDPDSLHPTEHFNRLIAREISRQVLETRSPGVRSADRPGAPGRGPRPSRLPRE